MRCSRKRPPRFSDAFFVGKIIGHGDLNIFGHVEGEVRASTIVIAEGALIEGEVSAEELTIGGFGVHGYYARRREGHERARDA
jgi:cytoskeletal protein CcmA (bactofilin family)